VGGLGLHLVKQMADEVVYERRGGGNRVRMRVRLRARRAVRRLAGRVDYKAS
jgi:anti-sigma regulatory factor (Ser/Thr protein kinase)